MNRLSKVAVVVLCLLAVPAFAVSVFVDPVAPTSKTPLTVYVTAPLCGLQIPSVSVTGSAIDVNVTIRPTVCIATPPEFTFPVNAGIVPPGDYTLTVRYDGQIIHSERLIVRDESTLRLSPWSDSTSGGRQVRIMSDTPLCTDHCGAVSVEFGGVNTSANGADPYGIVAAAPAHSAGPVDIVVRTAGDNIEVRAKSAFIYHELTPAPDPFVYERALIPTSYTGPGSFNAQFVTEGVVHNASENVLVARYGLQFDFFCPGGAPCPSNLAPLSTINLVLPNDRPNGSVVYVPRDTTDQLDFGLRVRDTSRQADGFGTEIPLVRESEFLRDSFSLVNVPSDERFRLNLRLYALDPKVTFLFVRIYSIPDGQQLVSDSVPVQPIGEGAFATSVSLLDRYPQLRGKGALRIEINSSLLQRQWAFVSVTNNETQQITVVTPQ